MAGQVHADDRITGLRSDDLTGAVRDDRSEGPILPRAELANLLDRLPVKQGGNNLRPRRHLRRAANAGVRNAAIVHIGNSNRSGRDPILKVGRHPIRAGDHIIARNKKIVAEVERRIARCGA